MSSMSTSRARRRQRLACENCRKKKIRCPGERPACSTCTRLLQECIYLGNSDSLERESYGPALHSRLELLEEKIDLVIAGQRPSASPTDRRVMSSRSFEQVQQPAQDLFTAVGGTTARLVPPPEVVEEVVGIYFRCCHKQPLWLFDRQDVLLPLDQRLDEMIFSILAVGVAHSTHPLFQDRSEQFARKYRKMAQKHIMSKIVKGEVQLPTLQSLCLLAFANFIAEESHLANLHIGLVDSLVKEAGLHVEFRGNDRGPTAEKTRKLFWSVHILTQIYGRRSLAIGLLKDVQQPKYIYSCFGEGRAENRETPPLMPSEPPRNQGAGADPGCGIWGYAAQMASLWNEVRTHVALWRDGEADILPWSAASGYTTINAHLMDIETEYPSVHRYDAARFWERSSEELENNRDYWTPWLSIQFTYHAVHSLLNHPFLYSSQPHQDVKLAVPNSFWKRLSETALTHTTWIVRLLELVSDKNFQVYDPFLGHCVAIAATVHLYYCRTEDSGLKRAVQKRFSKCMAFLWTLGSRWPVCRTMHDNLGTLTRMAMPSNQLWEDSGHWRTTLSVDTSLMWQILDYTCAQRSTQAPGRGLYHPFLCESSGGGGRRGRERERDHDILQVRVFHHPKVQVDITSGGQERPPRSELSPTLASGQSYRKMDAMPPMGTNDDDDDEDREDQNQMRAYPDYNGSSSQNLGYLDREELDQLGGPGGPAAEGPAPNQEIFISLGPENMRNSAFANMDFDFNADPSFNSWDFGSL